MMFSSGEGWVRETPINKLARIILTPLSIDLRVLRRKTVVPMYLKQFRLMITEESVS